MAKDYQLDNKPRNIFRFALATYRLMRDPANVEEAAIVELTFNRARWGKKIARWDLLASELVAQHPQLAAVVDARPRLAKVDLQELLRLPDNTLGHILATLEIQHGCDPNLVDPLPDETAGDWLMAHTYETHDFWHVLTGFDFDMEGEFGVAGFYMGQMPRFTFIAFMLSLLLAKTVWQDRDRLDTLMRAFCEGYEMGRNAQPLVGLDWSQLWRRDIEQIRRDLALAAADRIETATLAA